MNKCSLINKNNIEIRVGTSDISPQKSWIAFVLPFGLELDMAQNFFDFFEAHYNVVTWESRLIIQDSDKMPTAGEFLLSEHVDDLCTVLGEYDVSRCMLVGYCSGAGVALAAASLYPELFRCIVLEHGEFAILDDLSCVTQHFLDIDALLTMAAKNEENLRIVFDKISESRVKSRFNKFEGIDTPFSNINYFRRYSANYLAYRENNFLKLALTIRHKVLLTTGKKDVQTNVNSTTKIAELLSNSEVRVDPTADHYEILKKDSSSMITIWNFLCAQQYEY